MSNHNFKVLVVEDEVNISDYITSVFTAIDDYLLRKSGDTTDHGFIDEGVYELSKEAITLHSIIVNMSYSK